MASRVRTDYRTVNGVEKAAIIMLSVGEDAAQELFALMDEDEIRELSQTMVKLGTIDAQVLENLFVEFADQLSSTGSLTGTIDSTERMLAKALPNDRVKGIMEEIRGPAGRTRVVSAERRAVPDSVFRAGRVHPVVFARPARPVQRVGRLL